MWIYVHVRNFLFLFLFFKHTVSHRLFFYSKWDWCCCSRIAVCSVHVRCAPSVSIYSYVLIHSIELCSVQSVFSLLFLLLLFEQLKHRAFDSMLFISSGWYSWILVKKIQFTGYCLDSLQRECVRIVFVFTIDLMRTEAQVETVFVFAHR